jgi:hypothetical protein
MKIFKFCFVLLLNFLVSQISAQNILKIIEKDRDGKYLDKNDIIKEDYINNKIVDINSVLDIQIDRTNLISGIGEFYKKSLPDQLSEKINTLASAMKYRNEILTKIDKIVRSYDYEKFKSDTVSYNTYIDELQKVAWETYKIEKIDDRISDEVVKYEDSDKLFSAVYEAAGKVLIDMEVEIEQFSKDEGVHIQFGGWLITKNQNIPIHLQGFDEIAPQDPYEVERWQFIPTDQQLQEIKEIQQLAKENRDLGVNILNSIAQNQLQAFKRFGSMKLQELVLKLDTETKNVSESLGSSIDPRLKQAVDSIINLNVTILAFKNNLDEKLNYYSTISFVKEYALEDFIKQAAEDIRFITTGDGLILKNKIEKLGAQLSQIDDAILQSAQNVKALFGNLHTEFISGFNSFEASVRKKAEELIMGKKLDIAALEFGNEVFKLTLSDLPQHTELDLFNTGVRTDGDRLVLKLAVSDKNTVKPITLETRELYMFKVLPHIISTVGVIFADPLANTGVQTQFQMAPSYSVLYKGLGDQDCRRKSVVYNRLFDWGIGLNISAPDFNKDDVPELGAGVVISCLHDYLQSGFAFNVFTGDPYWFFGLRFPIPSFNVSTSSTAIE